MLCEKLAVISRKNRDILVVKAVNNLELLTSKFWNQQMLKTFSTKFYTDFSTIVNKTLK